MSEPVLVMITQLVKVRIVSISNYSSKLVLFLIFNTLFKKIFHTITEIHSVFQQ